MAFLGAKLIFGAQFLEIMGLFLLTFQLELCGSGLLEKLADLVDNLINPSDDN